MPMAFVAFFTCKNRLHDMFHKKDGGFVILLEHDVEQGGNVF